MTPSSEIIPYGSSTWIAGSLHRFMFHEGSNDFAKISRELPEGSEAIIKFVVANALLTSSYANRSLQTRHIVFVHLLKFSREEMKVVTASCTGIVGLWPPDANSPTPPFLDQEEFTSTPYRLMNIFHQGSFNLLNRPQHCPELYQFVLGIDNLLKPGLFLPNIRDYNYCSMRIMLKIPNESIQSYVTVMSHKAYLLDSDFFGEPWTQGVLQKTDIRPESTSNQSNDDLVKTFQTLQLETQGAVPLSGVPKNIEWLSSRGHPSHPQDLVHLHLDEIRSSSGGRVSGNSRFGRVEAYARISYDDDFTT